MHVSYCDHRRVPLPRGHRFPMAKYALLRAALVERGVLGADELHAAPLAPWPAIEAVHDRAYVEAVRRGSCDSKRIGFPWSEALVARCRASVGGTLAAARAALRDGIAGNLAGGTHHARRDAGAGYCVFNDIAVAAVDLLAAPRPRVRRVLVFDVDVHQGDGTAQIFAGDPRVFTCSLHGARNFPARKEHSDLDVELLDGTGDAEYLDHLETALHVALERGRPDIVFYQGGVDALASDRLGRLALSAEGLAARDRAALGRFARAGLPVVLTLGGGYAEPIEDSIDAHVTTYRVAQELLAGAGAS